MLQLKTLVVFTCFVTLSLTNQAQDVIPFDTTHWEIQANGYLIENFEGKDAIYLQGGLARVKNTTFLNGTIEFDIYITDRRGFPGVRFRAVDQNNMESFYFRPHQSGNPDANQAVSVINGISGWQLYFGSTYSFQHDYKFDSWTHVRLVIRDDTAQIYLNNADAPQLSWRLKHRPQRGDIGIGGGGSAFHFANFKVSHETPVLTDSKIKEPAPITDIITDWEISDPFKESLLSNLSNLQSVIDQRTWGKKISVEENSAANISTVTPNPRNGMNTVFAKITINSDKDQTKLFEFGYSDRVVTILNGRPIYKGTNQFRTRDYRYLGTIGLFDSMYLDLKQGDNIVLLAISESFGGWGVMGRLTDHQGITLK